jgi:hypothetical protein
VAAGDHKFPRWARPIIVAGIGVVLGLHGGRREGLAVRITEQRGYFPDSTPDIAADRVRDE